MCSPNVYTLCITILWSVRRVLFRKLPLVRRTSGGKRKGESEGEGGRMKEKANESKRIKGKVNKGKRKQNERESQWKRDSPWMKASMLSEISLLRGPCYNLASNDVRAIVAEKISHQMTKVRTPKFTPSKVRTPNTLETGRSGGANLKSKSVHPNPTRPLIALMKTLLLDLWRANGALETIGGS